MAAEALRSARHFREGVCTLPHTSGLLQLTFPQHHNIVLVRFAEAQERMPIRGIFG